MSGLLSSLTWSDVATVFNAVAATLVVLGYFMKGMIRLRGMATASNVFNFLCAALTLSDRKSTRLNSSHIPLSRMPSSA